MLWIVEAILTNGKRSDGWLMWLWWNDFNWSWVICVAVGRNWFTCKCGRRATPWITTIIWFVMWHLTSPNTTRLNKIHFCHSFSVGEMTQIHISSWPHLLLCSLHFIHQLRIVLVKGQDESQRKIDFYQCRMSFFWQTAKHIHINTNGLKSTFQSAIAIHSWIYLCYFVHWFQSNRNKLKSILLLYISVFRAHL